MVSSLAFFDTARADFSTFAGRFDIIGDVHGMAREFIQLLSSQGWRFSSFDPSGYAPIRAEHPDDRHLVFVGDMINKGPDSITMLRILIGMRMMGTGSSVMGNHEQGLLRALSAPAVCGANTRRTVEQLDRAPAAFRATVQQTLSSLPPRLDLPMRPTSPLFGDGWLTVVHAGITRKELKRRQMRDPQMAISGHGLPTSEKNHWADQLRKKDRYVVYGHTPTPQVRYHKRAIGLDTNAYCGNQLTMLRADKACIASLRTSQTGSSSRQDHRISA